MRERVLKTARGAILYDPGPCNQPQERWFEAAYWRENGAVLDETAGRGSVLIVKHGGDTWVLRHYHRGGFVARIVEDHYVWLGIDQTRPFREWRVLAKLRDQGLPVPSPVAARVVRAGPIYAADLITAYLPDTRRVSSFLAEGDMREEGWRKIGRMVRAFHEHGVDHPDLTAHNILLDSRGGVFLVDFDSVVLRPVGRWRLAGLARLKRSLRKVALETGTSFDEGGWRLLESAYHDGA